MDPPDLFLYSIQCSKGIMGKLCPGKGGFAGGKPCHGRRVLKVAYEPNRTSCWGHRAGGPGVLLRRSFCRARPHICQLCRPWSKTLLGEATHLPTVLACLTRKTHIKRARFGHHNKAYPYKKGMSWASAVQHTSNPKKRRAFPTNGGLHGWSTVWMPDQADARPTSWTKWVGCRRTANEEASHRCHCRRTANEESSHKCRGPPQVAWQGQ